MCLFKNDHGLYFEFTSNLKNMVVIMQHVTCAWKHVHVPTYCTQQEDTYVNGQVGISIKLSDMYCCM